MNQPALAPCPICNGEVDIHDYEDGYWRVICVCTVHGPLRSTEAEAIAAWNTRPGTDGLRDAAQRVVEMARNPGVASGSNGHIAWGYAVDALEAALAKHKAEGEG